MPAQRKLKHLRELYYITHINNIPSILQHGVLSHELVENEGIEFTSIYDAEIVEWRREKDVRGRSLWSFANLFFNPRNPMLYRVIFFERSLNDIAILGISLSVLKLPGVYITTGNAAATQTEFLGYSHTIALEILREADREYWSEEDGSKRKTMAECLIPDRVPPEYVNSIYVGGHEARERVEELVSDHSRKLSVIPQPYTFFQPSTKIDIPPNLSLLDGDMFFSRMQTVTVSVNTVGVMGKGVASRAKYQFPDVYVHYQDLCRKRKLKMGRPHLYKRESSPDYQLADEPTRLSNANAETWFLLFPTKRHWRDRADIEGIETGLRWLSRNYEKQRIRSLAIPALGCGLGRLSWTQVGPLLCQYLSKLGIPVYIYLPAERKLAKELLSAEFLLKRNSSN